MNTPFIFIADFICYTLLGLHPEQSWTPIVHFFIYDSLKILVLLVVMIYAISWIRAGVSMQKLQRFFEKRNRFMGYILGAILGAVTPFCSCSSIPLFLGFTKAGIPVGITLSFLISSPMINEAAVAMFAGTMGLKLTLVYIAFGLLSAILGGLFFDAIRAEKFIRSDLLNEGNCACDSPEEVIKKTFKARHLFAWEEVKYILKSIWLWVIVGVALGGIIHNQMPENFLQDNLANGDWWNVPLATLIGIPTYANITSVIPIIGALVEKGLPLGTAFAFMLSTVAVSLPEFIMLKKILQLKLIIYFGIFILICFTLLGYLLNFLQPYLI